MNAVNGWVRCPGCHDRLPTDRTPGQLAWVPCRNCGTTIAGRSNPLIPQ